MNVRALPRRELHLPDPHAFVLEEDTAADVAEVAFGHGLPS